MFRLLCRFRNSSPRLRLAQNGGKQRHQKKCDWLIREKQPTPESVGEPVPVTTPIEQPAEDRLTLIQVDLSRVEKSLLSLGPNFALTSRIDADLLQRVQVEIAASAYRLRWSLHLAETATCASLVQHLRQSGCPFQHPFAKTPPTHNVEMEDSLKQFQTFF